MAYSSCKNDDDPEIITEFIRDTVIERDTIVEFDTIIQIDTVTFNDTVIIRDTIVITDTIIIVDTTITPDESDFINFDGNIIGIQVVTLRDFGPASLLEDGSNPTHYNYDFIFETSQGQSFNLTIELLTGDNVAFQEGVYNFRNGDPRDPATQTNDISPFLDQNVFFFALLQDNGVELEAIGGTITALGSGTEWGLILDLTMSNGESLTGEFTGSVNFEDQNP